MLLEADVGIVAGEPACPLVGDQREALIVAIVGENLPMSPFCAGVIQMFYLECFLHQLGAERMNRLQGPSIQAIRAIRESSGDARKCRLYVSIIW
jgi:hypothetical protein